MSNSLNITLKPFDAYQNYSSQLNAQIPEKCIYLSLLSFHCVLPKENVPARERLEVKGLSSEEEEI